MRVFTPTVPASSSNLDRIREPSHIAITENVADIFVPTCISMTSNVKWISFSNRCRLINGCIFGFVTNPLWKGCGNMTHRGDMSQLLHIFDHEFGCWSFCNESALSLPALFSRKAVHS